MKIVLVRHKNALSIQKSAVIKLPVKQVRIGTLDEH